MRNLFNACLNGRSLQDLDEKILIADIAESDPKLDVVTTENAKYSGSRVAKKTRQELTVTITVMVRDRDPARRAMVLDKIQAWAKDGLLQVNYRPDQVLQATVTSLPGIGSAMQWSKSMTIKLTAYACPYWQTKRKASVALSGTEGSATLRPKGTASSTFLEFTATPRGAALASLTVQAGSTRMQFNDLNVSAGRPFRLYYDENMLLRIGWTGTNNVWYSRLANRTTTSDDDLLLIPGAANTVRFSASTAIDMIFEARGLYL